jgi:hypothetical protein
MYVYMMYFWLLLKSVFFCVRLQLMKRARERWGGRDLDGSLTFISESMRKVKGVACLCELKIVFCPCGQQTKEEKRVSD